MEKLIELEAKVIEWANDRNFFGEGGATLFGQYLKLREEFGELSGNFAKGRCMKDDIGDVAVVVIIMNKLSGDKNFSDVDALSKMNEWASPIDRTKEMTYIKMDCIMSEIFNEYTYEPTYIQLDRLFNMLGTFSIQAGYNFTECLEYAYNEIKDRKGEWRNNIFVKTSDL